MARLKQIESFAAVATKGSLTAAAHAEGVAPAVIGRRIDALEERLGVKLLVRTTRRITLTHEGSAFLEDCQRLLADLANAEASVSAGGVKASGHLRITAPAGFGRRHVAPLVPAFIAQHPDVSLSLNLSDRVVDIVNEGFDCAIRVGDLPDSSLVSVRLADNRRLCVAAPELPAARRRAGHAGGPDAPRVPDAELGRQPDPRLGLRGRRRGDAPAPQRPARLQRRPGACTTGACGAWASPGAAPGRWSPTSPPAACKSVLEPFAAPPNGIYAVFPQRKHLPLRVRLVDRLRQAQLRRPALLEPAARAHAADRDGSGCGNRRPAAPVLAAGALLLGRRLVGHALLDVAGLGGAGELLLGRRLLAGRAAGPRPAASASHFFMKLVLAAPASFFSAADFSQAALAGAAAAASAIALLHEARLGRAGQLLLGGLGFAGRLGGEAPNWPAG